MGSQTPPDMELTMSRALNIFKVLLRLLVSLALFLVLNILRVIAPDFTLNMFKNKHQSDTKLRFAENMKSVDDIAFLFSFARVQKQLLHGLDNALKDAQVGEAAPDPSVYDLTNRKTVSLLSTATPGRPLVLNFGSCS